ncbi:hypothetical protein FQA39_LY14075 [Lamprigera yunnana]|nr:hypothetical protein FQA39_LY14075 [Lamprigera yunnana]
MAIITLQFGQCGNQIGKVLYEEILNDIKTDANKAGVSKNANREYVSESISKWFYVNPNDSWDVRSILIDTEAKVISKANDNFYKFRNLVVKAHGGAANNWAYGYCSKSKLLMADIEDGVRREVERGDGVSSIVGMLSSAGGTGSGVGSRTLEMLRDLYPNKIITSVIVLPYIRGEVVTQSYNSLLTLTKLYDATDAIFLYENDIVHRMCSKYLSLSKISFDDINGIIAQQLATTFQPLGDATTWNVIKNLSSHPNYKLIQIRSAPHIAKKHLQFETSSTWSMLVAQIKSSIKSSHDFFEIRNEKKLKCTGNIFIKRGPITANLEDLKPLSDPSIYVSWLPPESQLSSFHQSRSFKDVKIFATFLSNNNYVYNALDNILNDALLLYNNKAYLHHYERFGINKEFFDNAFDEFNNISEAYAVL